jgi:hypothetical protein
VLGIVSLFTLESGPLRTALGWISIVLIIGTALWTITAVHLVGDEPLRGHSQRVIYRSGWIREARHRHPARPRQQRAHQPTDPRADARCGRPDDRVGGESGQQKFHDINHPERVQNQIYAQIDARLTRGHGGSPGGSDVASQLEKLEGLLERGTLSREEFDREKRRLLGT